MKDFNFVNLNEFSWQLNIALAGLVFAIFSLVYNDYYIYYGLLTFGFGLLAHVTFKFFYFILKGEKEGDMKWLWYYLTLGMLITVWIYLIFLFYK